MAQNQTVHFINKIMKNWIIPNIPFKTKNPQIIIILYLLFIKKEKVNNLI